MPVKLWHFQTRSNYPDNGCLWYFWQRAAPYKLVGEYSYEFLAEDLHCEVFSLGGKEVLWSGQLGHVPERYRSFLTEVRVQVRPLSPPA